MADIPTVAPTDTPTGTPTGTPTDPDAPVDRSLMDNPEAASDREHGAIDYAHAAGQVVEPIEAGPGDMPVQRQNLTFEGFMSITRYGGTAVVLLVFWATLVYAMGGSPLLSALSTFGLGLLLAAALKLRGAYFLALVGATVVFWIVGAVTHVGPDIAEPGEIEVEAATDSE